MKVVKVCPECKKYNSYKAYECVFCGANLNDDTKEVEDDQTEEKVLESVNQEKIEPIKVEQNLNKRIKTCPLCGSKTSEDWCPNCGMFLEGVSSDSNESENSYNNQETQSKDTSLTNLVFTLTFNGSKFNFNAISSSNTLGRHDFDSLNNNDFISVSRKHIEYYLKDNQLIFKDISSYGTYLNNVKMEPNKEYIISNNDKVKLVYFEMEINF